MRLSNLAREVLTVLASRPADRPWVLYRMTSGPSLMRPDQSWLDVPQQLVDRLLAAQLLAPVAADGAPDRVAYWLITEKGRAAVPDRSEHP